MEENLKNRKKNLHVTYKDCQLDNSNFQTPSPQKSTDSSVCVERTFCSNQIENLIRKLSLSSKEVITDSPVAKAILRRGPVRNTPKFTCSEKPELNVSEQDEETGDVYNIVMPTDKNEK